MKNKLNTGMEKWRFIYHFSVSPLLRVQFPIIQNRKADQTFAYIQEHGLKAVALCSYIKLIRDRNSIWRSLIG